VDAVLITQNIPACPAARLLYVIGHDTFPGAGERARPSSSVEVRLRRSKSGGAAAMPCSVSRAKNQWTSRRRSTSAVSRSSSHAIRPAKPTVSRAGVEALRRFSARIPSIASRRRLGSSASASTLETLQPPQFLDQLGCSGGDESRSLLERYEGSRGGRDLPQ
jgi:hypothetical protein